MFGERFWVSLALVVFIALVYKPVGRMIGAALDSRSTRIKDELDEAVRLREEAQALLSGYQRRQGEAAKEAEDIVAHARDEAERDGFLVEACGGDAELLAELRSLLAAFAEGFLEPPRAEGLGTTLTTIHAFHDDELKELLGIPSHVLTAAMIPMGWPMGRFGAGPRCPVREVTHIDEWGHPPNW